MAICGEKYERLLVTASGMTPEKVSRLSAVAFIGGEYSEWRDVALKVAALVRARWNTLNRAASAQSEAVKIQARVEAFFKSVEGLPSSTWLDPFTPDDVLVGNAIMVAREGTCLLELADDALKVSGLPVPKMAGGVRPSLAGMDWQKAGVFVGVLALLYTIQRDRSGGDA